jgi:hypothetical protein
MLAVLNYAYLPRLYRYTRSIYTERYRWINTFSTVIDKIADLFGYETVQEIGGVAFERARLPRAARGPFCYLGGSAPRL